MSRLKEAFEAKRFVVTSEIAPPKGTDTGKVLEEAQRYLKNKVCAINVTDNQSAVMKLSSLATCHLLVKRGLEPVFQLTCRDRNRIALQSDIISAWTLGIENILCITGDYITLGDHAESKPVFDLDSVQLVKTVTRLNEGYDLAGHELEGAPNFLCGAVVTPVFDPIEVQVMKMEKKIAAGAKFFQTQAIYEPKEFEKFMHRVADFGVPILAGIVVLKSAGMAKFMNENVAGVFVPDDITKEMAQTKKEDRKKKAIEISARIIREIKPICHGIHIMPLGWDDVVPEIISQAGLE